MDCDFAEFIINIIHIARYFCGCYNSSHIVLQVNNARWGLGDALCDTWIAFDVLCCTASILNLAAISFDRSVDLLRLTYTLLCTGVFIIGLGRLSLPK